MLSDRFFFITCRVLRCGGALEESEFQCLARTVREGKSRRVSKAETLRYPLLKIQGGGSKYSTQVLWGENACGGFRRSAQIAQNVPCGHKASANRHGIFAKFRDHDLQPAGGPGKGAAPQRKK